MNPGIEIRRVGAADMNDFRELRQDAVRRHPDAFGASPEEEVAMSPAELARRLSENLVLGAWNGERLSGMLGVQRHTLIKLRHIGLVWGVYVRPEARGQGLGKELFAALDRFLEPGIEQLCLGVGVDNAQALGLYQRCGFTIYGREPRALKVGTRYIDEFLMQKKLRDLAVSEPSAAP